MAGVSRLKIVSRQPILPFFGCYHSCLATEVAWIIVTDVENHITLNCNTLEVYLLTLPILGKAIKFWSDSVGKREEKCCLKSAILREFGLLDLSKDGSQDSLLISFIETTSQQEDFGGLVFLLYEQIILSSCLTLSSMDDFAKTFNSNINFTKCKSLVFKAMLSAFLAGNSLFLLLKKSY